MGEISIPSSDLHEAYTSGNPVEKWYPLMRRKDKDIVTGDIKVRLAFVAVSNSPSFFFIILLLIILFLLIDLFVRSVGIEQYFLIRQ